MTRTSVLISGNNNDPMDILAQQFLCDELLDGKKAIYVASADYPEKILENMKNHFSGISENNLRIIDCYSARNGVMKKDTAMIKRACGVKDVTAINVALNDSMKEFGHDTVVVFDRASHFIRKDKESATKKFFLLTGLKLDRANATGFFVVDNDGHPDFFRSLVDRTVHFSREGKNKFLDINNESRVYYKYRKGKILFEGSE